MRNRTDWPWLSRLSPRVVVVLIGLWLAVAWSAFLVTDIFGWVETGFNRATWHLLFNDRPVEWTQWFVLAFAVAISGYLAGRLEADKRRLTARFFFLFAIGLGLMLIEEAGDIRHALSREVLRLTGETIFGLNYRVVAEVPYFAALAALPLYALIRYGRYAWQASGARIYLVMGAILYATAAISSALRHLNEFYTRLGSWIDVNVLGGRFPAAEATQSQQWTHFFLVDSVLEETIELLAATMILAAILAFARDFRRERLPFKE